MALFAALMTYLVAAALLVGGMVTGLAVLMSGPSDAEIAAKPRPPLVRAADRKGTEQPKAAKSPQSAPAPAPKAAANQTQPNSPALNSAESAKRQAARDARKKKMAKPAAPQPEPARAEDSATLGYSPSEPRKFVFPFDPEW